MASKHFQKLKCEVHGKSNLLESIDMLLILFHVNLKQNNNLKPMADVSTSSIQGYQWSTKELMFSESLKNNNNKIIIYFLLLMINLAIL